VLRTNIWKKALNIHQDHHKLIINWTKFLATICILLTFRFIVSIIYEWLKGSELKGEYMIFIHVAFWLIVFLKILISPEILYGLPKLTKKAHAFVNVEIIVSTFWNLNGLEIANEQDKKLKEKVDTHILSIIEEIEFLAINKNYFRNQKITIADMSNELSVPTSHLVYIFKYHCNLTFTEYKTIIKIEDAKKLIESGFLKVNTLESLAIEVGFSSYNPFFTAFKKIVGKSPNEYSMSLSKK
jgi:AraC-like DNA-binding protein